MKICILTNFTNMDPGYSLVSIVQDQCAMYQKYGHNVDLWVDEKFTINHPIPKDVCLRRRVPHLDQIDYEFEAQLTLEHNNYAAMLAERFTEDLTKYDLIITHDFVFTGWNMPLFLALQETKNTESLFLHWIHSVPRGHMGNPKADWWEHNRLGSNHKLVTMTEVHRDLVKEKWMAPDDAVLVIPHIKDLRTFADFSEETCRFIDKYPNIMQADIVCIYPAGTDRLNPKQVWVNLALFGAFKRHGLNVCFVVANQWATGKQRKEDVGTYKELAETIGLRYGDDEFTDVAGRTRRRCEFLFTSDFDDKYDTGLPKTMIRELMMMSNLFIFPTKEESFGLVAPEASLMGAYMVLNKDVPVLAEVFDGDAHLIPFGSLLHAFPETDPNKIDQHFDNVAREILVGMKTDKAIQSKTTIRKNLNIDKIYYEYYEPLEVQRIESGL